MLLVEEVMDKMLVNGPGRQKNNGNKEKNEARKEKGEMNAKQERKVKLLRFQGR